MEEFSNGLFSYRLLKTKAFLIGLSQKVTGISANRAYASLFLRFGSWFLSLKPNKAGPLNQHSVDCYKFFKFKLIHPQDFSY